MGATCAIVPLEAAPLTAARARAIAARLAPLLAEVEWDGAEPVVVTAQELRDRRTLMSKASGSADAERAWVHLCQCAAVALWLSRELPTWRWTIEDDLELAASGFGVAEVAFRGGRVDGDEDDDRAVRDELERNLGPGASALLAEPGEPAQPPRRRRPRVAPVRGTPPATTFGTVTLDAPSAGAPADDPERSRLARHRASRNRRRAPVDPLQLRLEPGERACTIALDVEPPTPDRGHLSGTLELFDRGGLRLTSVTFSHEGWRQLTDERGAAAFHTFVTYQGVCAWARAQLHRVEIVAVPVQRLQVDGVEQGESSPAIDERIRVRTVTVSLRAPGTGGSLAMQPVDVAVDVGLSIPLARLDVSVRFFAAHGGILREVGHRWTDLPAGDHAREHREEVRRLDRFARASCTVTAHVAHPPFVGGLVVDDRGAAAPAPSDA